MCWFLSITRIPIPGTLITTHGKHVSGSKFSAKRNRQVDIGLWVITLTSEKETTTRVKQGGKNRQERKKKKMKDSTGFQGCVYLKNVSPSCLLDFDNVYILSSNNKNIFVNKRILHRPSYCCDLFVIFFTTDGVSAVRLW